MNLIDSLNAFQSALSPTDKLAILHNPHWPAVIQSAQETVAELHRVRAELMGRQRVELVK